jgi:zinc transport system substrate-binding protein
MRTFRVALVLALSAALAGPARAAGRITVLTSVLPLQEFAAAVVGDRGEAGLLLPPGASVHNWQPRPGDILKLASADLFISVGAGLEPWLDDVLKSVPPGTLRLLEVSRGLELLPAGADDHEGTADEHGHGAWDPHFWLDFGLDRAVVEKIVAALSEVDPSGSASFRRNADALEERLRLLDARFSEALKGCAGKTFVVAGHAAFGYLARRYGLVQKALYGLSPDAQPRPRQMMDMVDYCRREGLRTVFFETSVPPDLARTLAAEIGGRVLVLYAGHSPTREQVMNRVGFFDMMEHDLQSLRDGLGCR